MLAECPHCRYQARIKARDLGLRATCPKCERSFILTAIQGAVRVDERTPLTFRDAEALCPRCDEAYLEPRVGELHERRCPMCEGSLVDGAGVEELLREFFDLETTDLPRLEVAARKPLLCPSCETPMEAIFLRDIALEHCSVCAAIWFDGGELHAVTQGRHGRLPTRILPANAEEADDGEAW